MEFIYFRELVLIPTRASSRLASLKTFPECFFNDSHISGWDLNNATQTVRKPR